MSDETEEFHPYVRLLLARMKSNPDDFLYETIAVPIENESFFTEAEKATVWEARRELALGRSHSKLMERILKSNEPKDEYETSDGSRYRASELYRAGLAQTHGNAGQVLASSTDGYTWSTSAMDRDALLAQQKAQTWGALRNTHQGYHQAAQGALMQNQLGAQSPQAYSGAITMPATTASALDVKTETASEALTGVINKLLGR